MWVVLGSSGLGLELMPIPVPGCNPRELTERGFCCSEIQAWATFRGCCYAELVLTKFNKLPNSPPQPTTMSTKNPTPSDRRRGSRKQVAKPKYKPASKPPAPPPVEPTESQAILDCFHNAFSALFTPRLPGLLQTVKTHLFNRDFLKAFGERELLEAYVVRWSPSRALCYREMFLGVCEEVRGVFGMEDGRVEVVCIGGGAGAEMVAVAAVIRGLHLDSREGGEDSAGEEMGGRPAPDTELEDGGEDLAAPPPDAVSQRTKGLSSLHLTAIDIADWTPIVQTLTSTLTTPSSTSPAFIPASQFSVSFHHHDILTPTDTPLIPPSASLITLLFTTNELYTQSRVATTRFLLGLKERTRKGCLLLVLESAGSYSTVQVNGKTFPMGMLLDHTLLSGEGWEKLVEEEASWYRLPEGLRYPIELENMRYMVRVYKRT